MHGGWGGRGSIISSKNYLKIKRAKTIKGKISMECLKGKKMIYPEV